MSQLCSLLLECRNNSIKDIPTTSLLHYNNLLSLLIALKFLPFTTMKTCVWYTYMRKSGTQLWKKKTLHLHGYFFNNSVPCQITSINQIDQNVYSDNFSSKFNQSFHVWLQTYWCSSYIIFNSSRRNIINSKQNIVLEEYLILKEPFFIRSMSK